MAVAVGTSAAEFLPSRISLNSLREASKGCRGCPLFMRATQTVFGLGPARARVILVGEQPGNAEDLEGKPFVGPAGRILDDGLERAGIARDDAYVTNVVKHFKWEPKGKSRIHKKPSAREISACMPWLEEEVAVVKPEVLVCLGATAAQALLGRDFRVSTQSGKVMATTLASHAVATMHPSSILRQRTDDERHAAMDKFVADLTVVAGLLRARH
jgi:uracil-DNA glycosylase family protein